MLLQTWSGNQSGILWHGIQMNHKRNRNFEDTFIGRATLYSVCRGPMHVPFGIKYQQKLQYLHSLLIAVTSHYDVTFPFHLAPVTGRFV